MERGTNSGDKMAKKEKLIENVKKPEEKMHRSKDG